MIGDYISIGLFLALIAISYYMLGYYEQKRQLVATLQMYQHHTCPVLVTSNFPGDTTVKDRAQHWRDMLELSGNKWYIAGKITVQELPYNAAFSGGSLYGMTWAEYQLQCAQVAHSMIMDFQQENKTVDPLAVTSYRKMLV